eukprot:Sspe_Gene.87159::Locus_58110_Transcript_2_3_Confidence_0.667_Length_461::g.87159::m.87159
MLQEEEMDKGVDFHVGGQDPACAVVFVKTGVVLVKRQGVAVGSVRVGEVFAHTHLHGAIEGALLPSSGVTLAADDSPTTILYGTAKFLRTVPESVQVALLRNLRGYR